MGKHLSMRFDGMLYIALSYNILILLYQNCLIQGTFAIGSTLDLYATVQAVAFS